MLRESGFVGMNAAEAVSPLPAHLDEAERPQWADRRKRDLFAAMSHELRTPLTAVLGYVDLISCEMDRAPNAEMVRACLKIIRNNGQHLLELVNDILDLSKIEAGMCEIQRECFSPRDLLNEVEAAIAIRASAKSLEWRIVESTPLPSFVRSDAQRIRQVLLNLAGNAVKFTDRGEVRLEASSRQEAGEVYLQFDVVDSGIGLTARQQSEIFEPFVQVFKPMHHREAGTGLGLAICRHLATLLGGSIRVESEPGRGSRFIVEVPIEVVCPTSAAPTPSKPSVVSDRVDVQALRGLRVLIAEDSTDNRRLIEQILQTAGAETTAVVNGVAAITAAIVALRSGRPFDCILMDMQMPVLEGHEATRRLREQGYCEPIIALTAAAMPGERALCFAAGCDEYQSKPIDRECLIRAVRDVAAARCRTKSGATAPSLEEASP